MRIFENKCLFCDSVTYGLEDRLNYSPNIVTTLAKHVVNQSKSDAEMGCDQATNWRVNVEGSRTF